MEFEGQHEGTEATRGPESGAEQPSQCLLCGLTGPTLSYGHWMCDHCKNVVQAEALSRKRRIIQEGGGV